MSISRSRRSGVKGQSAKLSLQNHRVNVMNSKAKERDRSRTFGVMSSLSLCRDLGGAGRNE
jgi:hypothetical protein